MKKFMNENWENCWKPLIALKATTCRETENVNAKNLRDWEISSRATVNVEGSTTILEIGVDLKKGRSTQRPFIAGEDIVWSFGKPREI